jgi:hypothetical protein
LKLRRVLGVIDYGKKLFVSGHVLADATMVAAGPTEEGGTPPVR